MTTPTPNQTPADVAPTPDVVTTIKQIVGDDTLTAEQVNSVLNAWNAVLSGDAVGMIRRSDSGDVAHRVNADGVHLWRISKSDGTQYNDTQSTLPWPVLFDPPTVTPSPATT